MRPVVEISTDHGVGQTSEYPEKESIHERPYSYDSQDYETPEAPLGRFLLPSFAKNKDQAQDEQKDNDQDKHALHVETHVSLVLLIDLGTQHGFFYGHWLIAGPFLKHGHFHGHFRIRTSSLRLKNVPSDLGHFWRTDFSPPALVILEFVEHGVGIRFPLGSGLAFFVRLISSPRYGNNQDEDANEHPARPTGSIRDWMGSGRDRNCSAGTATRTTVLS